MNRLNLLAISLWLIIGIYGIFYNLTYIDEAKYLIKGWLIITGQVGYYSTPEFFYQHMPGGLLWYGFGQRFFGPSLLVARSQSFLIGLIILRVIWLLAKTIKLAAAKLILPLMVVAPVTSLYYSSAVPQSLAALTLITAFYYLFKNKFFFATIWFSLAFIIRENFIFTLIFYWLYLWLTQRRLWLKQILVSLAIISLFILPGWPFIFNVLKNLPGASWILPISPAETTVLSLNWQQQTHSLNLYWQAIKEFLVIYFGFLIALVYSLRFRIKMVTHWHFLILIVGFNFFAHVWSAFNLSPRAIVPYFAYIYPLAAIIPAVWLSSRKINQRLMAALMLLAPLSLIFSSLFQPPTKPATLINLSREASQLKNIVADRQNILWLSNPMLLFLAGKTSYYPLINQVNFYKASTDTATVKRLGFWNQEMFNLWLANSDLIVIDYLRLPPDLDLSRLPKSQVITFPEASPSEK